MKSQYIILIFLCASLFISCSVSRQAKKDIHDTFESYPGFEQGFSGLMVYDPTTEEVILSYNANKYFTPASNTKLVTFYTGLTLLGDSIPALKYAVQNDSLVFQATGDPSFLHPSYPDSPTLSFLKAREEQLFYAAPQYLVTSFGPGWAWDDYNASYSVERSAFPIHGNFVRLQFSPDRALPFVVPNSFKDSLLQSSDSTTPGSRAIRDRFRNRFVVRHNDRSKTRNQIVPFKTSPESVVDLLSYTLDKKVRLLQQVPESFGRMQTLYSIPAVSIYKKMLQESDNFLAEQVLLMAADALSDTLKTEIAIDYMQENHLDDLPDELQWVDGSGLSRYNLFTPRSMVELLKKIRQKVPRERLLQLLPAGGESGTLRNFYKAEEPYVYAKTGTLNNNHSLSGYLKTKSGKLLIFSFMNSNYVVPTSEIMTGMEQILQSLRDNF